MIPRANFPEMVTFPIVCHEHTIRDGGCQTQVLKVAIFFRVTIAVPDPCSENSIITGNTG